MAAAKASSLRTMPLEPVPARRWRLDGTAEPQTQQATSPSARVETANATSAASAALLPGRAIISLGLVYLSLVIGLYAPWALLMLWWAVSDLRRGETWLSQPVFRSAHPAVFWIIVVTWLLLGAGLLGADARTLGVWP